MSKGSAEFPNYNADDWLKYRFSPCGNQPIPGFTHRTCMREECGRQIPICMKKTSYYLAQFMLEGEAVFESNKNDLEAYFRSLPPGQKVVDIDGQIVTLSEDNLHLLIADSVKHAEQMVAEVELCVALTIPLTQEYVDGCNLLQQVALSNIYKTARSMGSFQGSLEEAKALELQMQDDIVYALDLGLGELDFVAWYAVGFGLGRQVRQGVMPLIFKHPGPNSLEPIHKPDDEENS